MRRMGSMLRGTMGGVGRAMVNAGDGWFLLATVLLLALPVVLLELLYLSGLPAIPFEVLLVGLGLAIAGFYWRVCQERGRGR